MKQSHALVLTVLVMAAFVAIAACKGDSANSQKTVAFFAPSGGKKAGKTGKFLVGMRLKIRYYKEGRRKWDVCNPWGRKRYRCNPDPQMTCKVDGQTIFFWKRNNTFRPHWKPSPRRAVFLKENSTIRCSWRDIDLRDHDYGGSCKFEAGDADNMETPCGKAKAWIRLVPAD